MKQISDYIFSSEWHFPSVRLHSYENYEVLRDIGELKKGAIIKFIGFVDADNHHGIFVFVDADGRPVEVPGDYSHREPSANLKAALATAG